MKQASTLNPSALRGRVLQKPVVLGTILLLALLAFEMFNFDTTKFALNSLMGDVRFLGLQWATILAIAFCAIDFAGLARLFTPEQGGNEPKEVWYLMGAWLLGATMNAMMTWWAVSLTLLDHSFGNEVLSREQLLTAVPIFVAVLVWLTRILFIGSLSVAGDRFIWGERVATGSGKARRASAQRSSRQRRAVPKPGARYQPRPPQARENDPLAGEVSPRMADAQRPPAGPRRSAPKPGPPPGGGPRPERARSGPPRFATARRESGSGSGFPGGGD